MSDKREKIIEAMIRGHDKVCTQDRMISGNKYIQSMADAIMEALEEPDKCEVYECNHLKFTTIPGSIPSRVKCDNCGLEFGLTIELESSEKVEVEWEKKFDKALLGEWDKFLLHIKSKNFIREEVLGKLKEDFLKIHVQKCVCNNNDTNEIFKKWGVDV